MTDTNAIKLMLKDAYKTWHDSRGKSVDKWMEIMDENVCFGSLAEGAKSAEFTEHCNGRAELKHYFDLLLENWEMHHYKIEELVGEGDRIVAIGKTKWANKKTGKAVETRKVDTWRFKDGRAIEFYEYYDTAALLAAAS